MKEKAAFSDFDVFNKVLKPLAFFLLPFILTALVYDSQKLYIHILQGEIHVKEPRDFDLTFFGIKFGGKLMTPPEWFQLHTHPALDLLCGAFYLVFIAMFAMICAYFYFYLPFQGRDKKLGAFVLKHRAKPIWAFFIVNVIGYATYYIYPAAPPWYADQYGLGPAIKSALPSAAGALRFDHLLGTKIFTNMYSHSANVFGAIPSLHVSYPLIAMFYSFKFKRLRIFSTIFYAMMCFSAVYLNHHYVIDILVGSLYAVLVCTGIELFSSTKAQLQSK